MIYFGQDNTPHCPKCDLILIDVDNPTELPAIKKKYIWMMKSEPMNEFVAEGGTYEKYLQAMLFHIFLVAILGSSLNLAASIKEEVRSNDFNLLFRRDHSERYTPCQTGEIMSEGIGTDGDISMEGATLLYKPSNSAVFRKILCTHLSNDKQQDASTTHCNIEYVLNNIDRDEIPREKLNAIFDITDGCAVQYCCGVVLYSLAQIATGFNVKYT